MMPKVIGSMIAFVGIRKKQRSAMCNNNYFFIFYLKITHEMLIDNMLLTRKQVL